jgi:hypothetical protein
MYAQSFRNPFIKGVARDMWAFINDVDFVACLPEESGRDGASEAGSHDEDSFGGLFFHSRFLRRSDRS